MSTVLTRLQSGQSLFHADLAKCEAQLASIVNTSSFLILGGAGSIGQSVTKEIFKRNPKKLHVVDLSENNTVELVRDLRSSFGYIDGEFKTFSLDIGSIEYDFFIKSDGRYDYVLNLSALKHVRSEKDPYTLMRMIDVNIFNTNKTIHQSIKNGAKKYFCVSTDKAANPVNIMGATKRIMEKFLMRSSLEIPVSMARFANVAFSDGSLLHGFHQRVLKKQPIVAPTDVQRYFLTLQESGQLCLMSCIFGDNRDIFFPKLSESLRLTSLVDIAIEYLEKLGFSPFLCKTEQEARDFFNSSPNKKLWPCFFSPSDTTGEKDIEEFFTKDEILDVSRFASLGVVKNEAIFNSYDLDNFSSVMNLYKQDQKWTKSDIVNEIIKLIPNFNHNEKGKYLDGKM